MNRERKISRMNDDTIYRQAAIDAIVNSPSEVQNKNIPLVNQYDGATFRQIEILGILETLPSAERTGRWIENEFGAYCSECGLYAYRSNGIPWKSNYCPMCGAAMMDDNAIQHTKCVGNALDALDEVEE